VNELVSQHIEPKDVSAHIARDHAERVQKVNALADGIDAEYAFQALITSHICEVSRVGYRAAAHGSIPALAELAAFHLYPLFGNGGARDPKRIEALLDALTELNNFRGLQTAFSVDNTDTDLGALQVHLRLHAEAVRGSSFPHQIRHRIENIQGRFESWFQARAGIGPVRALQTLDAFEKALNENFLLHRQQLQQLTTRRQQLEQRLQNKSPDASIEQLEHDQNTLAVEVMQFMEALPLMLPCSFAQIANKVSGFTPKEWNALRELIGLTPSSRQNLQQAREIQSRPIYFLSGNRFVLIDISTTYDALFEAFDQLTRTDLSFRDKQYIPHLAKWMENEAADYLGRLFPPASVYRRLTYPDPDNPGGETELDVAVAWGPFLVLVEVKGKQFRTRSRFGDPARLRDDLKDNIEEAFEQATRATRFVESVPAATFVEKGTGRKLHVDRRSLQRIFPISVTLHHFSDLATQLALLKRLGLFKDSAYPWSVSLADLDLITRFVGTPDVFLHYVQRRIDLQRTEKRIAGDELDVFGHYLDTRLHPSKYWDRKTNDGKDFTYIHIADGSERFDEWFQADEDQKPQIGLKLPKNFAAIVNELRRRGDDAARWIAFALLELSDDNIAAIAAGMDQLRNLAKPDGRYVRGTFKDGDVVVSLIAARRMPRVELEKNAVFRATVEKYRLKTSASLVIAIDADDISNAFSFAGWAEGAWVFNAELERHLDEERPKLISSAQLPGRNGPCVCGSGRKFKKCCLGKVSVFRR
jgi:hypothetical protein